MRTGKANYRFAFDLAYCGIEGNTSPLRGRLTLWDSRIGQVQMEASGGRGQIGGLEQGVRTIATVHQASDLDALPITLSDGRFVRLDQLATIADTYAERTQAAALDGKPVVGFRIYRARGADETRVASTVEKTLDDLRRARSDLVICRVD